MALLTILATAGAGAHAAVPQSPPGWLGATAAKAAATARPTRDDVIAAARAALAAHGGHGGDADDVRVLHTKAGTHVVMFVPRIDGMEVSGARANVLLDRQLVARAITGNVAPAAPATRAKRHFAYDAGTAVKLASASVDGLLAASAMHEIAADGSVRRFVLQRSVGFVPSGPARAEPIWHSTDDGLVPAWRVTLRGGRPGETRPVAQGVVVAADDGRVLAQSSLIREHQPFSYRVYAHAGGVPYVDNYGHTSPHPTGVPDGWKPTVPAPMNLVTRVHAGISTGDPWLPDDATETVGNNVDAFFDAVPADADGYCDFAVTETYNRAEGDLRAAVNGSRTFDYAFDVDDTINDFVQCDDNGMAQPVPAGSPQLNAKVVQMFYATNWLHDYFYDLGFDEAAGNMQASNYGRGGIEGDPVILHAGGFNAYTMVTSDGVSPVITLGINPFTATRRDSSGFDFTTLGHEWTHAVMNRLNPYMPQPSAQYYALGEGTADYVALMISLREQDRHVYAGKPAFSGAYPGAGAYGNLDYDYPRDTLPLAGSPGNPDNSYYHGVRRFPYSVDAAVNPLMFRHISMDHPLPESLPRFDWKLRSLANAYAHTAGEMWGTAMWQCSRNILAAAPPQDFAATRDRILSNVLAGVALFPPDPTYIEARDAMLFAMRAGGEADYLRCRAGFATRGMGAGALGVDKTSVDFRGVVESTRDAEYAVNIVDAALVETAGDGDGILDRGDTGRLDVTLKNTGFSALNLQLAAAPYLGGYELPNGGLAESIALAPGERRTVSFAVRVTSRTGRATLPFAIATLDVHRPWIGALQNAAFFVNADKVRDRNVDTAASDLGFAADWKPAFGPRTSLTLCLQSCVLQWQRAAHDGVAAYRIGSKLHTAFDAMLDSTPFLVDANAPLTVTLTHDHDFDRAPGDPLGFAGIGRLFVSTDGTTWTEAARYTGTSNGWTTATANLGTNYAGRQVRLRLHATASPSFTSNPAHWAIARIEVQGAAPMFTRLVDDVD